jgi:hypothetical protein
LQTQCIETARHNILLSIVCVMFLPFDQYIFESALHELAQRAPFMLTKFADNKKRRAGQERGLVIEHHVRAWLRDQLKERVLGATNEGKWQEPCNHDLRILCAGGQMLMIDISGPKSNGTYGSYAQKPGGCHFHILARPFGMKDWEKIDYKDGFEITGVVTGAQYQPAINLTDVMPIANWLAMLEV